MSFSAFHARKSAGKGTWESVRESRKSGKSETKSVRKRQEKAGYETKRVLFNVPQPKIRRRAQREVFENPKKVQNLGLKVFKSTLNKQDLRQNVSFSEKSVRKCRKSAKSETRGCPLTEELFNTPAESVQNGVYKPWRNAPFTAKAQHSVYNHSGTIA